MQLTRPLKIRRYFHDHEIRKLHIGCGRHILDGWLNVDRRPKRDCVVRIDLRKRLPFADNSFQFVYSEHLIEHLEYVEGARMLAECHRILAPGGKIRISTPDLDFLLGLQAESRSKLEDGYIRWSVEEHVAEAPIQDPAFVINNFFRDWGHRFIHSKNSLNYALTQAGFVRVTPCRIGTSDSPDLCGLENVGRMPDGYLELESLVLEAEKQ